MQTNQPTQTTTANGIKVYSTAMPPDPPANMNAWTLYINQTASKKS